jgi:hypothetical protein
MKSVTQPKYNPLGGLIRALLAARGLKAFELAEKQMTPRQAFLKALQALSKLGIESGSGYVLRLKKRMGDLYEEVIIAVENQKGDTA